ncbi:hypothetical protein [Bradyrhizobium elkanii]|uniref:hypothetical protein n=2 Tax=Bradyrhizobium elkanii TaxID=29448 RepID=UPI0024761790|nr:hypothetical protein [Bradyrhizobium elkanii]MDH6689034.1 hypothetical protein [Bradyrhizobium elkanii]
MNSLLTLTHSGIADQSTATPFGISSHTLSVKTMAKEFSAATAAGHCSGENRALLQRRLEHLLPKTKENGKVRGPHPSLPYEELSAPEAELASQNMYQRADA